MSWIKKGLIAVYRLLREEREKAANFPGNRHPVSASLHLLLGARGLRKVRRTAARPTHGTREREIKSITYGAFSLSNGKATALNTQNCLPCVHKNCVESSRRAVSTPTTCLRGSAWAAFSSAGRSRRSRWSYRVSMGLTFLRARSATSPGSSSPTSRSFTAKASGCCEQT